MVSAMSYIQLQQHSMAISLLNQVVECEPSCVKALLIRSKAHECQGDLLQAMKDLQLAYSVDTQNPSVYDKITKLRKKILIQGQREEAPKDLNSTRTSSLATADHRPNEMENCDDQKSESRAALHPESPSHIRIQSDSSNDMVDFSDVLKTIDSSRKAQKQ